MRPRPPRPSTVPRRGTARAAGIGIAFLALVLLGGAAFVLKGYLQTPAPANGAGGGPSAGTLGGGGGRGATVGRGSFSEESIASFDAAQAALAGRRYSQAKAILSRMLESDDHAMDPNIRLAMAEALLGENEFEAAYRQYEGVIALEGKAVPPALHFQAGTVASRAGMLDRAEEHYSMAQSADPARADYPLFLAMVQLRKGQTDAGVASLLRVIKLDQDIAEAWGTLAEVYLRDNKLEIALPNVRKARELQPLVGRWRMVEARILKRQADPTGALELLLAMDPADQAQPEAMKLIAECYGMLRQPSDAAEMYAKAAQREPSNAQWHYEAALWFQRAGDLDRAKTHARTAAMLGHEAAADLQRSLG